MDLASFGFKWVSFASNTFESALRCLKQVCLGHKNLGIGLDLDLTNFGKVDFWSKYGSKG